MAIEGTGIKSPSKKAERMAMATYRVDPIDKMIKDIDKASKRLSGQESTGGVKETGRGMGDIFNPAKDFQVKRPSYFSPGGGAFDERNDVQLASSGFTYESDTSFLDRDDAFNKEQKEVYGGYYDSFPGRIKKDIKLDYLDRNPTQYQQFLNKAPVKEEKPTIGERVASFTGGVFNTLTGTQSAVAQTKELGDQVFKGEIGSNAYNDSITPQYQINREQNRPSNLDAAKNPSGDTSFASYRMGGGEQKQETGVEQQQGSGIVTPFSQTSMGKGEARKITPFSETSMGKREPVKVTPFRQTSMGNKTVTVDGQKVAARQTVASLPSDYKQTEAREFAKAETYQRAKKNPNVTTSIDSKGQVTVKPVQRTRDDAGPSARTAQGNQARVKQNAVAKAQAAAYNRKLSGTKPKTAKQRAQDAAKARKAAGPNRKMSAGQQTRSQAGASARTAQGNRARVKANARKRAQAAAKKRRAKKKGNKKCDIFLKYNISPLTNMNLIRDDLAEVAYFVKEIQK